MAAFVHHHVHSAYSLAEGAIRLRELAGLCASYGTPAVSVTDTNNLFGALEISETLSEAGVQPILGLQQSIEVDALAGAEARWARAPGVALLAQSETGFQNLMTVTSKAHLSSARDDGPCADFRLIEECAADVVCLTGGHDGPLDRLLRADRAEDALALLRRMAAAFPNRLYVELQRHEGRDWRRCEAALVEAAYDLGLPLVATNEPFFTHADDFDAHDALLCVADGAYVHQDDRRRATRDHYFKTPAEMIALFDDLPEAIASTTEIARRCAFRPKPRAPILPRFAAADEAAGDPDAAEAAELERQAREGLDMRLEANADALAAPREAYAERLEHELGVIRRMGFPGYFLIVADFIKWAKEAGVPVGPGRGSGAGSLVAWALTITDLDPLRFGLLFERFLNPERVSMPDFDIDFCQERRDEVIAYVQEKYGASRVAQIITFGKLQARAVLRDVGRVLGMPFGQVDRLCKLVPNNPANPTTLAEALESEPRLAAERDADASVAALLDMALKLEGLYRHASTHAAGVVIGDRPLQELAPLYQDPRAEMAATQYNMRWVELAGLVKFDFLGLKTLTVIERALALARGDGAETSLEAMPFDDPKTFQMLSEGAAVGVFQLESAGMRATLRSMRPDALEDLIALISLYRPGPMENIPTYVERKQGRLAPDYLHPSLEPILKETYGVIIYQEQVMRIAQTLSGYSLGEADLLRRAMGKKKKEEMDRQRRRFVDGAVANGVEAGKASSIFDLVQKFAGYGFNKSHAAAYALVAYQTAYLKANEPAAFLAASMSLDKVNTDKLAIFVNEARRIAVDVAPPHVNHSQADFSVRNGEIVYALGAVKNVNDAAMSAIAEERAANGAFRCLFDLAERVDLKAVGKRALENLARAGAFDGLGASRPGVLANVDLLVRYSAQSAAEAAGAQGGLFDAPGGAALERPSLRQVEAWSRAEALNEELAALGFYLSGHPLDEYKDDLERIGATSVDALLARAKDGRAEGDAALVVRGARLRRSRSGKPFAWVACSDAAFDGEAMIFSEALERCRDLLTPGALVLCAMAAEERDGEARLTIESMATLDAAIGRAPALRVEVSSLAALRSVRRRMEAVEANDDARRGDLVLALRLGSAGEDAFKGGLSEGRSSGGGAADVRVRRVAEMTPSLRAALLSIDGVEAVATE
ncbi:MAG: DNA polymerase III subunit alpha [Parvularculaceae bacterium]